MRVNVSSTARWSPAANSTNASAESSSAPHQRRPASSACSTIGRRVCSCAFRPAPARVDERPEAEHHRPRPRPGLADRHAARLDEPLGLVPVAGPELGEGAMGLPLRPPVVLAAQAVPLVLDGVAGARGLEVVDRVEVDQRDRALRHVRPRPRLELPPALEQLGARMLRPEEPGPEPVDADRGHRARRPLGIQGCEGRVGTLDAARRVVRHRVVDESLVGARDQFLVGGLGRQCLLEARDRALPRAGDPEDLAQQGQRRGAQVSDPTSPRRARRAPARGRRPPRRAAPPPRRACGGRGPRRRPAGVSRPAASKSSAAARCAPLAAACCAARSSTAAISSSGSVALSARWRARCSVSDTTAASRSCSWRRRSGDAEP